MGKKTFIGINGTAQKAKKLYIGIDNKARRIKKMYIGINNIAHCIYSGGELKYKNSIPLKIGRVEAASTTLGDYALFNFGKIPSSETYNYLEVFDKYLVRSEYQGTSAYTYALAATSNGTYALFGGGYTYSTTSSSSGDPTTAKMWAYNKSFTNVTASNLNASRAYLAATSVGNYALFAGGRRYTGTTHYNTVDAYDQSLTKTSPTALGISRAYLAATSIGDYAIFGGGYNDDSSCLASVDVYNKSLTRTNPTGLSLARRDLAATSVGKYAIFGGGLNMVGGAVYCDTVDVYDSSLTKVNSMSNLSVGRRYLTATSVANYALFGGGVRIADSTIYCNTVDAYDESLTRTNPTGLSYARDEFTATSVGNYALFGGGYAPLNIFGTAVDVYEVS